MIQIASTNKRNIFHRYVDNNKMDSTAEGLTNAGNQLR